MAKKTVLQYVQATLGVMDSDEVDSINDTTESMQIAALLYDIYFELINRQEWSFMRGALTVTSNADTTNPTQCTLPENCKRLRNLAYNIDTAGGFQRQELKYLDPVTFLRRFSGGVSAGNRLLVSCTDKYGVDLQFYVNTDRMPSFWTSFDDQTIFTDAYNATIESTLTTQKIIAWGDRIPSFDVEDDFIPDLPDHMIPLLQHTLNGASMQTLKQQESPMDAIRERRQTAQARRAESKLTRKTYYWNKFGRKGAGMNLGSGRRWWDSNNSGWQD